MEFSFVPQNNNLTTHQKPWGWVSAWILGTTSGDPAGLRQYSHRTTLHLVHLVAEFLQVYFYLQVCQGTNYGCENLGTSTWMWCCVPMTTVLLDTQVYGQQS